MRFILAVLASLIGNNKTQVNIYLHLQQVTNDAA